MKRVPLEKLKTELKRVLLKKGFSEERAKQCASLFSNSSLDGVSSHGLNRFIPFLNDIDKGIINIEAVPAVAKSVGAMEQWDGQLGPGMLNAQLAMNRACELASIHGLGLLAMRNTNHWMRGGSYGWQAAEKGFIGICFSNTKPNMPAWGGIESVIGNNPLIISLPRKHGHIVLDSAQSQFSFGTIENYSKSGHTLPFDGGYDRQNSLTKNPDEILETQRSLPAGLWKGSGMAIVLDIIASTLSLGKNTFAIGKQSKDEYGISQIFIAIDPLILGEPVEYEKIIENTISSLRGSTPMKGNGEVYYPGERTLKSRKENLELGVPVEEDIWNKVLEL